MTTDITTATHPQQSAIGTLERLLSDLLKVPGVRGAVLATQDGLKLTYCLAGQGDDEETNQAADRMASVISGAYGLAGGICPFFGGTSRDLQLAVFKHLDWTFFITSAGRGVPTGTPLPGLKRADQVECTLGVLSDSDADEAAIGHEMRQLVLRMERHLRTDVRRPELVPAGDGQ